MEIPAVLQKGFEERFCIQGEVLDGLVLTCHLLGSGKILLSWSFKEDSHAGARDVVVALELLPPLWLEGSGYVKETKAWLQLIELLPDDDLLFEQLQPLLCTIAILEHPRGLLDYDHRVLKDPLLP